MNKLLEFEKNACGKKIPDFNIGDTVVVSVRIMEEG